MNPATPNTKQYRTTARPTADDTNHLLESAKASNIL